MFEIPIKYRNLGQFVNFDLWDINQVLAKVIARESLKDVDTVVQCFNGRSPTSDINGLIIFWVILETPSAAHRMEEHEKITPVR